MLYVNLTLGLSIPMPKAFVATITEVSPAINFSCSVRTSPPIYVLTLLLSIMFFTEDATPILALVSLTPILPRRCGQKTIAPALLGISSYHFSLISVVKSAFSICDRILLSVIPSLSIKRFLMSFIFSSFCRSFNSSNP